MDKSDFPYEIIHLFLMTLMAYGAMVSIRSTGIQSLQIELLMALLMVAAYFSLAVFIDVIPTRWID